MNHYFYDHQGAIVDQLLSTDRQIRKGDSIMFTSGDEAVVYLIQSTLHIQGEPQDPKTNNWLVNRLTKLFVNMSHIDTKSIREPLPLKSVQGYQEKK